MKAAIQKHTPHKSTFLLGTHQGSLLYICILILLSCLTYLNTLNNGFHVDDEFRIMNNPGIQTLQPIMRHFVDPSTMSIKPELTHFRPLVPLSFSINYVYWDNSLPSYHWINIGFHTATSIVLFFLSLILIKETSFGDHRPKDRHILALMVAAIFAVHPVSGMSINYITNRDLLMMEFFFMSSFLLYVNMRKSKSHWAWWIPILIVFLLSLLSKQNAVVMPALVLIYEWSIKRRPFFAYSSWLRAIPFAFLVMAVLGYSRYVLDFSTLDKVLPSTIDSFMAFPLLQLKAHVYHYLVNFFWPLSIRIGPYTESVTLKEWGPWLGLGFFSLSLILAFWSRARVRLVTFCILAYWISFLPTSSLLPMVVPVAHYRSYPSSFYLYFLWGIAAFYLLPKKMLYSVGILVTVYFIAFSVYLNTTWKTEETLWKHSMEQDGAKKNAVNVLNYAMSIPDMDLREMYLRKSLALAPNYNLAKIDLGLTLIHQKKNTEGLKYLEEAVTWDPDSAHTHYWLAMAYQFMGNLEKGLIALETAHQLDPTDVDILYELILQKQTAEAFHESISLILQLRNRYPHYKELGFLLGFAYQQTGSFNKAKEAYANYLEQHEEHIQTHFNLAHLHMSQGLYEKAVKGFQRVLQLDAKYYEAHLHLSTCYKALGNELEYRRNARIWGRAKAQ